MSEVPTSSASGFQQTEFEKISLIVREHFQVTDALLNQGIPTYYLVYPQETKQAFLRLLDKLVKLDFIAYLRKIEGQIVLTVAQKPPVKPSNRKINLAFLIATIATTFISGYLFFSANSGIDPMVAGAIFSASILTVLGIHEMGHKIMANKRGMDATMPYFIPGIPPLGTFGAVIMQKSLPRNRDALFDIGANGPLAGFVIALLFSVIGLTLSVPAQFEASGGSMVPLGWIPLVEGLMSLNLMPIPIAPNNGWFMHPIAYAGWVGMIVTMLNLLPAAMLDGGHVARSVINNDRLCAIFTFASVAILLIAGQGFFFMAFLVLFMSMFKHPGPLDDVSGLSKKRKLAILALVACFIFSFPIVTS